jgi:glycosyltransferase involved in cell wall biosynthesis
MINILIRTSNRPMYFAECIRSITSQTYKDVNIIVGNDNFDNYCENFNPVDYSRTARLDLKIDTAKHFPYNSYLNELIKKCKTGYVLILDDDDMFTHDTSLEEIMLAAQEDMTVFWKVRVGERIVPSPSNWGKAVNRDISMIGMAFSTKWIPLIWFAPYKQADYRLAHSLIGWGDSVWIPDILTNTQRDSGDGMGLRDDKS